MKLKEEEKKCAHHGPRRCVKWHILCHLQRCMSLPAHVAYDQVPKMIADMLQVPVFEFNVEGNHVMRRRVDHYINATHILKVADYDKPARTRILEREVQKGVHEKIQGGYGKYQGE